MLERSEFLEFILQDHSFDGRGFVVPPRMTADSSRMLDGEGIDYSYIHSSELMEEEVQIHFSTFDHH